MNMIYLRMRVMLLKLKRDKCVLNVSCIKIMIMGYNSNINMTLIRDYDFTFEKFSRRLHQLYRTL